MKTIKEIKDEIEMIMNQFKETRNFTKKELKAPTERLRKLRFVALYLESEPRESFIESEVERLKNELNIAEKGKPISKYKPILKKIKDQIEMISFILN